MAFRSRASLSLPLLRPDLKAQAEGFDLSGLSPVLSGMTPLKIREGTLTLGGQFLFGEEAEFSGDFALSSLVLREAALPDADLLRVNTAKAESFRLVLPVESPFSFTAKKLLFSDFQLRATQEKMRGMWQALCQNPQAHKRKKPKFSLSRHSN